MTSNEDEKIAMLALSRVPNVGSVTAKVLISYCGSAQGVFRSGLRSLIRIPHIGEKLGKSILKKEKWAEAEKEYAECLKTGIQLYFFNADNYPLRLKGLYDSPLILYAKGNVILDAPRTLGIVGTRKISDYGRALTEQIIKELTPYSPLIISGLAYGVDILSHRESLKGGLPTIGVMASGLDVIYPYVHKKTAEDMMAHGGLLTENPLGTKPDAIRFPARNRIIAGLSDVVVVVESALSGGSLITAEFANEYHREVFAVPGPLNSPTSEGCNQLIRTNKAAIFTSAKELAEEMRWNINGKTTAEVANQIHTFDGFSKDEGQILALLRKSGEAHIDQLCWQSELPMGKISTLLLSLEFRGAVCSLPGKKYKLA